MSREVERVGGVDGRQPNEASPADHVAGTVVLDVHGGKVSGFPKEEFENVDQLQGYIDKDRVTDITKPLILGESVGNNANSPVNHAKSAVCELFDVPPENAGVKFSAPIIVENNVASDTTVSAGGKRSAFDVQQANKDEGKKVH